MIQNWRTRKISEYASRPRFTIGDHHQRTDKVSVLEVEPIELIACLFGVMNVFINHKRGALGVIGNSLSYLSAK